MTNYSKPYYGGPAFPSEHTWPAGGTVSTEGMTLRDWFAGQAMAGILGGYWSNSEIGGLSPRDHAEEAYQIADAMLAARAEAKP